MASRSMLVRTSEPGASEDPVLNAVTTSTTTSTGINSVRTSMAQHAFRPIRPPSLVGTSWVPVSCAPSARPLP